MDTFLANIRFALRGWMRTPGPFLMILLTFALGIGANAAIFSFIDALLLKPLPFAEPEQLVRIASVRGNETGKLMPREWEELNRRKVLFASVAAWYPSQYNLTSDGGPPESVPVMMTTGNIFELLGVRLTQGNPWPLDYYRNRHTDVVLGHGLWRRRFAGNPGIVGASIVMDASPYRVAGIAPPGFTFPVRSDIYRAANLMSDQNRAVRSVFVVGRLAKGVSLREGQSRLNSFAQEMETRFPGTNRAIQFRMAGLRDSYVGEARPYLLLTAGLVALVLLIACANVVNLLLSRAIWRRQEIATRAALGASRAAILRQLLTESALLSVLGGLVGVIGAASLVPLIRQGLRFDIPEWMTVAVDWRVLGFALLISIAAGMLAGLAPAIAASRTDLRDALQQGARGSSTGGIQGRLRMALVALEIALAFTLLAGAGLLVRGFLRVMDTDAGFNAQRLLTFRCDPPWTNYNRVGQTALFYRRAIEKLEQLPGIEAVAANHSLPLAGNDNYGKPSIEVEGQSRDEQLANPFVNLQMVSPGYFQVMGIRLLSGRVFGDGDRENTTPVAVIGRNLADRLFGVGALPRRRIRVEGMITGYQPNGASSGTQDAWFDVVGVVDRVRSETLLGGHGLDLYLSNRQQFTGDTYFAVKTATERPDPNLNTRIAAAIREVDPDQSVFDFQSMRERMEATVWQRRMAGMLSLMFGLLAIVLAAAGIYSVLAYSVSQRTREMGIRLALGASAGGIRRLILGEGLRVAGIGLIAGFLGALLLAYRLRELLGDMAPFDPLTFTAVPILLALIVFAACYLPAWRASRTTPLKALRDG